MILCNRNLQTQYKHKILAIIRMYINVGDVDFKFNSSI